MKRAEKFLFSTLAVHFLGLSSVILLVPDDAAGKSAGTRTGKSAPAGVSAGYGCDTGTGSGTSRCAYGSTLGSVVPVGAACATGENRGEKSDDAEFSHCFFRLRSAAPSAESGELPPL